MAIAIDGRSVIEINEDDHTLCQEYLGMDVHMNGRTGEIALKCLREYFNCRKNWALEEHELDFYIWVLVLYLIRSIIIFLASHVVTSLDLLFLRHIEEIASYTRGAVLLANLHRKFENHIKFQAGIYVNVHFLTVKFNVVFKVAVQIR